MSQDITKIKFLEEEKIKKWKLWSSYCLIIFTFLLVIVAIFQYNVNLKISESNEKLTIATTEFYKYHPPEVVLIKGQVIKLYVLKDSTGNYFTIVGLASVYNSALSDDIALIEKKYIKNSYLIKASEKDDSSTIEGNLYIEGNIFPIPLNPGDSNDFPLLGTFKTNDLINQNFTIDVTVNTTVSIIEVIHPINKTILANLTAFEPINIIYRMGSDEATVINNDINTSIQVRYTDDIDLYHSWKQTFLSNYGTGAFII